MDKSQTPPGRDGGSKDAGKKEYYSKPMKAKDAFKDAEKELNKAMDKNKIRKMYELADRLSKVDTSKLNEQELAEHSAMIEGLRQKAAEIRESNLERKDLGGGRTQYIRKSSSYDDGDGSGVPGYSVSMPKKGVDDENEKEFDFRDDDDEVKEAGDNAPHFNIAKLGGAIGADPRLLRMAIARGMAGKPTRQDLMVLADSFLKLLQNSDDRQIQAIANLIKAGNPREVPQESTAAIAERNAFVDAMRQAKKGEKFTVGGKEYTKTTSHGEDGEVKESINTEAYDRLKRVFDFSDYKG
jgi:hypothetical protein